MQANTTLDSTKIVDTVERLALRIEERFPSSGLHGVALTLLDLARHTGRESDAIDKPIYYLRCVSAVLLVIIGVLLCMGIWLLFKDLLGNSSNLNPSELVPLLESGANEVVLIGVVVFFLIGFERRIKRQKALKAIHQLRAVAHVIDMHQLTKDPAAYNDSYVSTASSPQRSLTTAELIRYLDYCSELLSLTGKLAALYIQRFDDEVALSAANDIENLTTQLSRKIWQKVMIAHNTSGD
jgi:hypothetical protein